MDLMAIRRSLMMVMIGGEDVGADFIKGSFTVSSSDQYTISFGKTLSKYMYLIEMTDESKSSLMSSGASGYRTYAISGMWPIPSINNNKPGEPYTAYRVNPSTGVYTIATETPTLNDTSITIQSSYSGASKLLVGYTYNYYIVEIK